MAVITPHIDIGTTKRIHVLNRFHSPARFKVSGRIRLVTNRMEVKLHDHFYKVVVLGDSGVGKTSILLRYSENTYDSNFVSTIGERFKGWGWIAVQTGMHGGEAYLL